MPTKMTDADWFTVLRVFEAVRSRRVDKGRDRYVTFADILGFADIVKKSVQDSSPLPHCR